MPFPSEHSARISDPGAFDAKSFKRKTVAPGLLLILAKRKGGQTMEAQAYRFNAAQFTADQAKAWLIAHKVEHKGFEVASGEKQNADSEHKPDIKENSPMNEDGLRNLMSELVRPDKLDGRDYLVAPVVLIAEGAWNGVLYRAEELQKFPEAWNGRPVVVYHPMLAGKPITANSPDIVEKQTIGQMFNCKWDAQAKKLKGEAWMDKTKLMQNAPEILRALEAGTMLEVSTGLFTEDSPLDGHFNGKAHRVVAANYRPDHLAILPDAKGACSVADGAGMPRVNSGDQEMQINEMSLDKMHMAIGRKLNPRLEVPVAVEATPEYRSLQEVFSDHCIFRASGKLFKQGYKVGKNDAVELVGQPVEVQEKTTYEPVKANDGTSEGAVKGWETRRGGGGGAADEEKKTSGGARDQKTGLSNVTKKFDKPEHSLFSYNDGKRSVQASVKKSGDRWVVKSSSPKDVEASDFDSKEAAEDYVKERLSSIKRNEANTNNRKGGPIMDRTEQVKALIALGAGWAEGDVELLTSMDDAAFAKVTELATADAAAKTETQKTLSAQAEQVKTLEAEVTTLKANAAKKPATAEEYVAAAPAEIAEVLRAGVAMHQGRKAELVTALKANARCKFSEDELKAKGLKELEALAELAALPSYAGVSGGRRVNTAKPEDNKMPEIDFTKKA